jgi:hypothetical protein
LYVKRPGWNKSWTDQGLNPTLCDILGSKEPEQPSCNQVGARRVVLPKPDEPLFLALARLEVVARHPERQREIFGWVTPPRHDFVAQTRFEIARARYWRLPDPSVTPVPTSVGGSLEEVHSLQDTADFHANYLLRLLYLYGQTPPHLRTHRAAWRRFDRFNRDINFSAQIEARVRNDLLAFKYWIDEPFFADDDGGKNLRQWRAFVNVRDKETRRRRKKHDNIPLSAEDATTQEDLDPDNDQYKSEMTFWSENHQILFATAEYLAGQLWPDAIFRVGNHFRVEGQDKSRPSDLIGQQHMAKAKLRILRWLNDRLRFGFSEWNSPGYYSEDFTALFNLADFCVDDEIQARACMVLDLMIFDLARFTHGGSFGVTAGRSYFEHKNCGYEQPLGDLIEVLFGTRGGTIVEPSSEPAGAFASSRRYQAPDVLVRIGQDKPNEFIDRSRVSINFEEAGNYNVGFESDEDVMFWWSRGAFFTKEIIASSLERVRRYHLMKTDPFLSVFPKLAGIAEVGTSLEPSLNPIKRGADLSRAILDVGSGGVGNAPIDQAVLSKLADLGSVVTEGPVLSRANLYTYRSEHAMLSSVQNFRPGQVSFQAQSCQATLSLGASVWTTYPAADDKLGLSGKHDGPNWWTGSATTPRVVQYKNAALVAYKPKDFQFLLFGHRTHAWFPRDAFESGSVIQRRGNCNKDSGLWTFGKVGDGYVGLFSAQTPEWTASGPWTYKELIADGARNFFIFQIGSAADFGSYAQFVDRVSRARIHIGGLDLVTPAQVAGAGAAAFAGFEVAGPLGGAVGFVGGLLFGAKHAAEDFECSYDIPNGDRLELHYDNDQVRYAGAQFSDDEFPRFENPYVSCGRTDAQGNSSGRVEWNQFSYTIKHNGSSLTHDFRGIKHPKKHSPSVDRYIDGPQRDCSLAEFGPRPFYVVGHNPNTIARVIAALDAGANAIEPDVNVYEHRQNELCISEGGVIDADEGGPPSAPSLSRFLDDLHDVAVKRPELALVVFDCKPKVATARHGATLLREIRRRLTFDTKLNVIISVSSLAETAIFDNIKALIGPSEGLMVDGENDPVAVSNFFMDAKVTNQCFGNGISVLNSVLGPNVRPSMERACEFRAATNRMRFIYAWSVNDGDLMSEFCRIGVDGLITDEPMRLRSIINESQFRPFIRFARRSDNPFSPANFAYGLTIQTADKTMGGTDANVTFTLTGITGSASVTVDTSLRSRMEGGAQNYVTLQSDDLGDLESITVQHDGKGNGPEWYLERVVVESFRYGVSKQAEFNRWIDPSLPFTQSLG